MFDRALEGADNATSIGSLFFPAMQPGLASLAVFRAPLSWTSSTN